MNQIYDISKVTILIQDSNFDLFKWDGQEVTQYELPEGYKSACINSHVILPNTSEEDTTLAEYTDLQSDPPITRENPLLSPLLHHYLEEIYQLQQHESGDELEIVRDIQAVA
jgi:hypothetical protein